MKTAIQDVLYLAPMAGITDWPMRVLCYQMGADYACSEMVSAIGLMCAKKGNTTYQRLLAVHPEEKNTACQIFGSDPVVMAEAASKVTELGLFTSIDINMGCPARKVTGGGEGSALLQTPELAYKIMEAVKRSTHLPVTVKTRLGYDEDSMNAIELGRAAQTLKLSWICFHGRTRRQQYSGKADYAAIARLRSELSIPVIANGDVFEGMDATRILRETGCERVMIGRGAMGNPWLFRAARQAISGEEIIRETLDDRIDMAMRHADLMADYKGEDLGVVEMRKHVGHYVSGIRGAAAIRRELNAVGTLDELKRLLMTLKTGTIAEEEIVK
ncbi:MAG: tRNA dihydrouridine synthase DusB [Clostridiales bacterium]|nr:tRNA dihydrouridine synthase DusB [Clostridiales bacterium]